MPESLIGTMIMDAAKSAGLMTAVAGAVADVQSAPGAAKAAAGRAAMKVPGVEKAVKAAQEGMAITRDIKKLASPIVGKLKKPIAAGGAVAGMAGGALAGGGKMAGQATKAMATGIPKMAKGIAGLAGKGLGVAGISLSVSSLLRQSQIFTGFIGALFQILGGFVDVVLAPFMPYLFKVLQMMAGWIPHIAEFAQKVHDWLAENVFPIIAEWAGKITAWITKTYNWVKDTLFPEIDFEGLKSTFKENFKVFTDLATPFFDTLKEAAGELWVIIRDDVWPMMQTVWDSLQPIIERIRDFVIDTFFPLVSTIFDEVAKIITGTIGTVVDTVGSLLERLLPIFEENILKIIEKMEDYIEPLKDSITGISETIVPQIEGFLSWIEDNIFPILEKFTQTFFDAIFDIFDLVEDLVKIAWPHIKTIMDEFDEHVKPVIDEIVDYALQIVDALLDIVDPLINLLTPIVKVIWKILWFFIEKILTLAFKLLGFVWMLVKPIIKGVLWVLTKLPAIINTVADFISGFLDFGWAIDAFFTIKRTLFWGIMQLLKGIDKIVPFGDPMKDTIKELNQSILRMDKEQMQRRVDKELKIEITNEVNGIKEPTEQESFDSSAKWQEKYKNQVDLGGDVTTWQPSFST